MNGKKRSSAKTLKTTREVGYFGKKILSAAAAAAQEGRPTAWSMIDWWAGSTISRAMGVELVFPENYSAFCAAVGAAESYLEYAESDGFPSTLCGYARNCIGYTRKLKDNNFVVPPDAPGGGMARPTFLLACGAVCDARYKWFQTLGRYMDVPVWTLEIPQTGVAEYFLDRNREENIKFMVQELKGLVSFLEGLLGRKMNWDNLCERLDILFKTHRLAYEIDLLRKAVPSPMVSTDFWSAMIPHLFLPEDKESLEFYGRMHDEVKHKVDSGVGALNNEKHRMMFSEIPPWHTLEFFDKLAEKHGIAFVIESWAYHVPPPLPEELIKGIADPLELLACYTYHKFNHTAPVAKKYGIDPTIFTAIYLEWAADYRVDGMMCHPLLSCRPASYTLMHLRNILMEKFKIPSVVVEGDFMDRRVFNEEEAYVKMDAFIETMDHFRELKKKEGLNSSF